jgi:hypothetical protein
VNISRKQLTVITVLTSILFISMVLAAYSFGNSSGFTNGINIGYKIGQLDTLQGIQALLERGGMVLNYTQQPDGSYQIQLLSFTTNSIFSETAEISKETFTILNETGAITDNHTPPKIIANVEWQFQILENGKVVDTEGESGNIITNIGDNYAVTLFFGSGLTNTTSYNSTCCIGLGNATSAGGAGSPIGGSSTDYGLTQLTSECSSSDTGFKRTGALAVTYATGTGIGNGSYFNATFINKFTASQTDTINATAGFWSGVSGSNNVMYNVATIGTLYGNNYYATFNNLDNATITMTYCIEH